MTCTTTKIPLQEPACQRSPHARDMPASRVLDQDPPRLPDWISTPSYGTIARLKKTGASDRNR